MIIVGNSYKNIEQTLGFNQYSRYFKEYWLDSVGFASAPAFLIFNDGGLVLETIHKRQSRTATTCSSLPFCPSRVV